MGREGADAGVEVALVVDKDLVAPLLADGGLVHAEAAEPFSGGAAIAFALRAHLDDFPPRIHRSGELLKARVETAWEDHVGGEGEVLQILSGPRDAIAKDGLEPEAGAGLDPVGDLVEVGPIEFHRHALIGLSRGAQMVDHLDRDQTVVLFFRNVVFVIANDRVNLAQLLLRDPLALRGGEGDSMGALDATFTNQMLKVAAPAAADIEDKALGRDFRVVRQNITLLDLCLLERFVAGQVARGRVVHVLVKPELEELVADIVGDFDLRLSTGHRALP